MKGMKGLAIVAALLMVVGACGGDDADITIEGAWARNSPKTAGAGAAYMQITSPVDDAIVGVEVDAALADHAEMHESFMDDAGAMQMRPVEQYTLVGGEMFELKPGSYHVMIIDLAAPLEIGQKFEVTLEFEKAGKKTVEVEVMEEAPGS